MTSNNFQFQPIGPFLWSGRYNRIPGRTSTFKIKSDSSSEWWPCLTWATEEGELDCFSVSGNYQVSNLVDAVNEAKTLMGGSFGGSFQINEFGQVLVPSQLGGGTVMIVGETQGVLLFENPLNGDYIDLSDTEGLTTGSRWDRPYIGLIYNLSRASKIYYYDERVQQSHYPEEQDYRLIRAMRALRRTDSIRFLVNMHGLVMAKVPVGEYNEFGDTYEPVYIGRINKELWFEKEEDY